jgi:hypothetical protein
MRLKPIGDSLSHRSQLFVRHSKQRDSTSALGHKRTLLSLLAVVRQILLAILFAVGIGSAEVMAEQQDFARHRNAARGARLQAHAPFPGAF